MQEILNRLQQALIEKRMPIVGYLNPGLPKQEIVQYFTELNLQINEEVVSLFNWRNGIQWENIPTGKLIFGPRGVYFPLQESINIYKRESPKKYPNYFFPIFSDASYLICLDRNVDSWGMVFKYSLQMNKGKPMSCFDSIPAMISTITECFLQNAYFIDDGMFDYDPEMERNIALQYNPKSVFWK